MDDVSEQALQTAQENINDASRLFNDAAAKLDEFRSGPDRPADDQNGHDQGGKQWDETFKQKQDAYDRARTAYANSNKAYADLAGKLALSYEANQRAAKDPNEQNMWAAQAEQARAHQDLYGAQRDALNAKTQPEIDAATARAAAATARAQSVASRVPSQNEASMASAALARGKLAQLPQLTASTIALHNSTIQMATAHAKFYAAQAARTEAQADTLIPAQADYYVQRGILTQAQAEQLKIIGPVKAEEIEAKLGVDKARADLIRSQIGKYQLAPGNDRNLPTLTEFRPSTGEVTGVANPSYVNPQGQSIKDTYAAIDQVQQQIASGQMTPEDGDSLIANLKQSLEATSRGVTPEQYQAQQQAQANFGQAGLDKIQSAGESQASTLLGAAKNVRGLGGMSFTPFANAAGMAGGDSIMQKYLDLIGQIKPVTDRSSLLDAIAVHGAANAVLKSGSGDQFAAGASDQSEGGAPGLLPPGMAGTAGDPNIGPTPPTPFAQSDIPEGSSRGAPDEQSQRLLQASMSGRAI